MHSLPFCKGILFHLHSVATFVWAGGKVLIAVLVHFRFGKKLDDAKNDLDGECLLCLYVVAEVL